MPWPVQGRSGLQCEQRIANYNSFINPHCLRRYRQHKLCPLLPTRPQSKRYSHGVRLAKTHELDSDLMNLALKSTNTVMIDTADYLFQKVGDSQQPRAWAREGS